MYNYLIQTSIIVNLLISIIVDYIMLTLISFFSTINIGKGTGLIEASKYMMGPEARGKIMTVKDGILSASNLTLAKIGELVKDTSQNSGIILSLEKNKSGVVMFTQKNVIANNWLYRAYKLASIITSPYSQGLVLSAQGVFLQKS